MSDDQTPIYRAHFQVTWADVDLNGHMANRAYLDYATQTRYLFAASRGFAPSDFRRAGVAPVMFEDRVIYHRELHFLEEFEVTHSYQPTDPEGRKFNVQNLFLRNGETMTTLVAKGGWIDMATRRVVSPPSELVSALATEAESLR